MEISWYCQGGYRCQLAINASLDHIIFIQIYQSFTSLSNTFLVIKGQLTDLTKINRPDRNEKCFKQTVLQVIQGWIPCVTWYTVPLSHKLASLAIQYSTKCSPYVYTLWCRVIIGTSWVNGSLLSIQQDKERKLSKQIVQEHYIIGLRKVVVPLCLKNCGRAVN